MHFWVDFESLKSIVFAPLTTKHHLPTALFAVLFEPAGRLSPHHIPCLERAAGTRTQLLRATRIRH